MNLKGKHFAIVLLGGLIGAGLGWVVSFALRPGLLPSIEDAVGLQGAGLVFGGIAGMAAALGQR
jgi:hypothetical protein